MHTYPAYTESVRLALAVGLILSILVYNRWQLSGGASIVPGILALFVPEPVFILTTLAGALASYWVVDHWLAKRMFLYQRRRLTAYILAGLAFQVITGWIAAVGAAQQPWLLGLFGIGFVFPGLIASDMNKQGLAPTLGTVLGLTLATYALLAVFNLAHAWLPAAPVLEQAQLEPIRFSFDPRLFTLAVILSILVGSWLYEKKNWRSAGFVGAAYFALFIVNPLQLAAVLVLGVLVYELVVRLLIPWTMIFGRVKFALILLTSLLLTWALELALIGLSRGRISLLPEFNVLLPVLVALIANDAEQQGLKKTLLGLGTASLVVFVLIKLVDLLVFA